MNAKEVAAIAAVLRNAALEGPHDTDGKPAIAERMRAWIAHDLARELKGIMKGFDEGKFVELCQLSDVD